MWYNMWLGMWFFTKKRIRRDDSLDYIKPKNLTKKTIDIELSTRTIAILEYYSRYTQYKQGEILDMFLLNLLEDEMFLEWIDRQRYNKKILALLYNENSKEDVE